MPAADVESIEGILVDQQRDLTLSRRDWIARDVHPQFQEMLGSSLIKVVMGIRRAGKSTLCAQAAPDYELAYCNFDDERLTGITTQDLNAIYEILLKLKPAARLFVFDEVQNVDKWELFVSRLKRKGLNVLVTGSNGKLLSQDLATNLTGRHLELELMPFSFAEFLRCRGVQPPEDLRRTPTEQRAIIQRHFEEYWRAGGFPEVVRGEEPGRYLRELFDKVISRDIAQRYQVRTPRILKELGLFLIQHSGSLSSLKKLLNSFQYRSVNTLRAHIGYLQDAYLLHEVPAYSRKVRERSTRPRKNYACDPGMMTALSAKPTPDWGRRLETLVYLHLRRQNKNIFYVRGPDHDVDFGVVNDRNLTHLIQVSYDMSDAETLDREIGSLLRAANLFPGARLQLITMNERRVIERGEFSVELIPSWVFCLQCDKSLSETQRSR